MCLSQADFMTQWIEQSGMESGPERFRAACKAWMESSERAAYFAAKQGQQTATV